MDIILAECRSQIDAPTFIQHLESGLQVWIMGCERFECRSQLRADPYGLTLPQDHYDVKMPAHSLLVKLAAIEPATTLTALERIVSPLEKTLLAKVCGQDCVWTAVRSHQ